MDASNECTWPEIKLRAHYLCWLAAALGAGVLLGLTFDLLVVDVTGGEVGLDVVLLVYVCAIFPPYVVVWRRYGEAHCGFRELEHALDDSFAAPVRLGPSATFLHVLTLIARIDQARGFERQIVRNEAKAWLAAHASELDRDEREYVADHLGYLHKP